jgi:geranylgeranyl pyrophosphate synthase
VEAARGYADAARNALKDLPDNAYRTALAELPDFVVSRAY